MNTAAIATAVLTAITPMEPTKMCTIAATEPEIITRERVLDAIKIIESYGRNDLWPHPDGLCWGEYGITQMMLDELYRCHRVAKRYKVSEIARYESKGRHFTGLFLDLCMERVLTSPYLWHETGDNAPNWLHAAAVYYVGMANNERCAQRRLGYIREIIRALNGEYEQQATEAVS